MPAVLTNPPTTFACTMASGCAPEDDEDDHVVHPYTPGASVCVP